MPLLQRGFILIFLYLMTLTPQRLKAQEAIFPTLTGELLLDSLQAHFKPDTGLDYAQARDTLYRSIMAENDSLTGIYTGYRIFLPPGQDPTQAAFDAGINAEHIYPQAKGAEEGMARADMHHIFPSRADINNDRGNLPFAEIPDQQTISWYFQDQKQSAIPAANIDAFSELGSNSFEPRESVKGDVARAMFYFYTMYRDQADLADQDYFPEQQATLCDWHLLDPVDQREQTRNTEIARYQDNKLNPYILDCTLAFRAFCPGLPLPDCGVTDVKDPKQSVPPLRFRGGFPNPFSNRLVVEYKLLQTATVNLRLINALGSTLITLTNTRQQKGNYRNTLNTQAIPVGIYYLQIQIRTTDKTWSKTEKLVKFKAS